MADDQPVAELDARFSSAEAAPTEWGEAQGRLKAAEVFWISTVRPSPRSRSAVYS